MIYDMMLDDFSEFELIPAPDNFSLQVMEKIKALPAPVEKAESRMENATNFVWGTFSVLLGIATLIALNRETILNYMLANESLERYARLVEANVTYFEDIFANAQESFYMMTTILNTYLTESRYLILTIVVVLVSAQIYIYRKEKVGV